MYIPDLEIRALANYLAELDVSNFDYLYEKLKLHCNAKLTPLPEGGKCYPTEKVVSNMNPSPFNSAHETRECMHRYDVIRQNETNAILEKIASTVNVLITDAAVLGRRGVSFTYEVYLSSFFPVDKLGVVFTALQKELIQLGYDVEFYLHGEIINISWDNRLTSTK